LSFKKRRKKQIPKEVTTEREKLVWSLRQQMWTQLRISKELKISQPAVNKILKRMTERFSAELMDDIIKVKIEQVAQHEFIADEYFQAWEKSKKRHKRDCSRSGGIENSFDETEESDQYGDPRYLAGAMKAKEEIRKILGADAPTKIDVALPDVNDARQQLLERLIKKSSS
jgi:predicted transcriptional regulator